MNISKDTVKYVANLAMLELSEKELEKFAGQSIPPHYYILNVVK